MRKILYLTLVTLLINWRFAKAQKTYSITDEVHYFPADFIKAKFLMSGKDSLVFRVSADTATALIDHVWSSDTTCTWVLVRDEDQFYNNCTTYYQREYQLSTNDWRHRHAFIAKKFLQDHHVPVRDVLVIFIGIKPLLWVTFDMVSYKGTDFLFKVPVNALKTLQNDLKIGFDILPNNFH